MLTKITTLAMIAVTVAAVTVSNAYAIDCENLNTDYCDISGDEMACDYGGDTGRTLEEALAIAEAWKQCN